ncbi:MAG TPA: SDR family oxidoreductase [Acidimicrobiia bacterium]|jgi:NAD(P)-dependent dehydrogenase (short-subunit alcohol dehydrogenase family)
MAGGIEGRVAVVTGGASGIGRETARRFVADGAKVVIADRNADLIAELEAELGAPAVGEVVDVTSEADVERMVARALSEWGRLDAAVNCAGFGTFSPVVDHPLEAWRDVIDTVLTGVFLAVKHEGRVMAEAGNGVIVNIASINATVPSKGMAAYCTAKAGVEMLTRIAAMELGERHVRVVAIGPGFVDTPLTSFSRDVPAIRDAYIESIPLGRAGSPTDIANAARFLVSDEASWVSGTTLFVDGAEMNMGYPDLARVARGD